MAFVVAHRAGNAPGRLRSAEALGIRHVEADVRLWRGRLEVRHLKTVGPLPLYWDRWALAGPRSRYPTLPEVLAAAAPRTELVLDLKGRSLRLAHAVRELLPAGRQVTICARSWPLLDAFGEDAHVRRVHSVGSERQLRRLLRRADRLDGVSIHERLLDARSAAELLDRGATLMTWPVRTVRRARELVALGVDGLIVDDLQLAQQLG